MVTQILTLQQTIHHCFLSDLRRDLLTNLIKISAFSFRHPGNKNVSNTNMWIKKHDPIKIESPGSDWGEGINKKEKCIRRIIF